MAPSIPKRPANPHRDSSNISQSSSFRSLFTHPDKSKNQNSNNDLPIKKVDDNRILPISDFPPQAERRRSSAPDLELELETSQVEHHVVPDSENINHVIVPRTKQIQQQNPSSSTSQSTSISTPNSRNNSINHKRSHSLRRKPVPSLLLNTSLSNDNQPLPIDHPFATSSSRSQNMMQEGSSSSIKSSSTGRSTSRMTNSPSVGIPDRAMGRTPPPPHRRGMDSPKGIDENGIITKKKNARPDTAGTFGGRRSADESRPTTAQGSQGQLSRLGIVDKEEALNARMISLSLDRPLPPTPTENSNMPHQETSFASSSHSKVTSSHQRNSIRPSVDTNRSKSIDLFDILRSAPSRRSQSQSQSQSQIPTQSGTPAPSSTPMTNSGFSGTKYKSKILRGDSSTEKNKKTSSPSSKENSEDEEFSVDRMPSKKNLWEAGTCFLRDENGELKCFGDFFPKYPSDSSSIIDDHQNQDKGKGKFRENGTSPMMEKSATYSGATSINGDKDIKIYKTVVFFIRHFWCGQCQDYTFASLSLLDPEVLEKAGIRVIIISNGSWKIIKAYKKLFNCPFPIYVDGPRRLYQLLGMTKMTNDFGPLFKGRAAYHQRAVPGQLFHGLGNAFFRMPLANPGTLTQLGGEFILSPGWNCDFAHRMTTTSDHMEAPDVLRLAGCANPTKSDVAGFELADSQKAEIDRLEKEMREWQDTRTAELERVQQKKAARRGVSSNPSKRDSEFTLNLGGVVDSSETAFADEINQALQPPLELKSVLGGAEAYDPSIIDAKLEEALLNQEFREKEKLAASELMLARGRGDLEIHVDSGVKV